MKKILVIAGIVVVALVALSVMRDALLKSIISSVASSVTGTKVSMQGFSLGVFKQSVKITGFKMNNPAGFPKGIMVDIPAIQVEYDLASLLKQKIHLKNVVFELKEVGLVTNELGKMNVDALKVAQKDARKSSKPAKQLPLEIDMVKLAIGKVVVKEYTSGKEPSIQVYDININKTYQNITGAEQLAALILAEPMKAAGIKGAAIYGVAAVAGVAVLPVGVAAAFIGKDSAQQLFAQDVEKVYQISLAVAKQKGTVTLQDEANKVIRATIDGAAVELKIKQSPEKKTELVVFARKFMLPKPEIAGGVLYAITEKLK